MKRTILIVFLGVALGCAPAGTQPVDPATATAPPIPSPTTPVEVEPTPPSGWETYSSQGECGYAISHPPEMEGTSQDAYSWILSPTGADPQGLIQNFIYISVIPADFQAGGGEIIYNYDPAAAETLLNMQVGESKPIHDDPNTAQWFTYTRLPDTMIGSHTAMTYENAQPWEFPQGTKEIRHYLQTNGCTYLIGGYLDAAGSDQAGAITEELFAEIVATFRSQ